MGLLADFEEKILNYRSLPSGHTNLRTQLNTDDRNKGKPGETKMLCGARAGLQTVQVCQIVQVSEKYRFLPQRFNTYFYLMMIKLLCNILYFNSP